MTYLRLQRLDFNYARREWNFEIDDVEGYCTTEEVAKWIDMVSKAKSIDDLHIISGIVRRDDYKPEEQVPEY